MMSQQPMFQLGFTNLEQEVHGCRLPVTGSVPGWLSGTLFRNGPAKFSTQQGWHTHWFDGLAMLHKFTFRDSEVMYWNKYLRTNAYRRAQETGVLGSGFGTAAGQKTVKDHNANVNVSQIDGHFVAMTETPDVVEFDPYTLDTMGVFDFHCEFPGQFTTAHPHIDWKTGRHINFTIEFGAVSQYHLYSIAPHSTRKERIGSVPTLEPSYIHSFAVTERYVIIAEFPFVVNPLELMTSGKSFIDNFQWKPERGTRFYVVSKSNGALVKTYEAEPFFSFHHVNAYEAGNGDIMLDICASATASVVGELQVDNLTNKDDAPASPRTELRRYRLPVSGGTASGVLLAGESMDLPTINQARGASRAYRYAYGISMNKQRMEKYSNQLVKADVVQGESKIWFEPDCYPGEPIFIEKPNALSEDDGVVVSVILDGKKGHSFLLLLDARTFTEIGRVHVPHHIPFGFHGMFTEELFLRHA
ncbi:Carotenoid cleavage oxygenase [Paenibacillus konkukensis]|uniref:Carotenoid cleavage oxygenase n=1 Tax=Paenibacillus konkukensis TaxID=2020716 RepID=A0ABY4RMT6_9BACL|nr:carotenoid oxygenase family protein [Paenibacillus konkukensis]UQZ82612.1 Carotenoid cleavage oxygenase [Paenibacillus konkukensis]